MVTEQKNAETPAVREEIPYDHLFKVTGLSTTNLEKLAQEPPADFETAIAATGYGWFNVALMVCTMPAYWSAITVSGATSYIFTRAQCDMQLSLVDMGTVNAITYGGMISSAMIWGFLSDTLGRRKIMVWGFLASGLVEVITAMSQNFAMILITRFASGFLFNGPFAVVVSYIAELHRTELRAKVILLTSLFYSFGSILLPLLAWVFLTQELNFNLFDGKIAIHSWNLFLLATAVMPIISGLAFACLPESPKFLMSRGRNDEALQVLRKIYELNTRNKKENYPIIKLVEEKSEQQGRGVAALRGGWAQLTPLFKTPHVKWLLLMCFIHLGLMFGSNTIRLWYPQLAAMIGSNVNGSLCSAITPSQSGPSNITMEDLCVPIETNLMTYLQTSVVGVGSLITYSLGGILINKCGKKIISGVCSILSSMIFMMLPFLGSGSLTVSAMVTSAMALTSLSGAALSSITVEMFPTPLRVMAMATFLMSGRFGTISGTTIFPALMDYGCLPPFIVIASVLAACGIACLLLVPKTDMKKLE